jgi:hypothetical protein
MAPIVAQATKAQDNRLVRLHRFHYERDSCPLTDHRTRTSTYPVRAASGRGERALHRQQHVGASIRRHSLPPHPRLSIQHGVSRRGHGVSAHRPGIII